MLAVMDLIHICSWIRRWRLPCIDRRRQWAWIYHQRLPIHRHDDPSPADYGRLRNRRRQLPIHQWRRLPVQPTVVAMITANGGRGVGWGAMKSGSFIWAWTLDHVWAYKGLIGNSSQVETRSDSKNFDSKLNATHLD